MFSKEGTEFGALEFSPDGRALVYAAQHADGHPEVLTLDLANRSFVRWLWRGQPGQHVGRYKLLQRLGEGGGKYDCSSLLAVASAAAIGRSAGIRSSTS